MFGIYTSPTAVLQRLKEKPVWLVPLVIAIVANLAVTVLATQYVDWDAQRETAIEQMEKRGMSEEQIEQATEGMEKFYGSPAMRFGLPLVGSLLMQVIGILFITLVFNLGLPLLGGSGNFRRMLAVVAHGSLIALPGAVVRAVLILLKQSAEVSTSLLAAFPGIEGGFLAALLARIDPFTIWQFILFGLGIKLVFDTRGSKSYWLVFGVWALITVVLGLLAMLGGGR